MRELDGSGLWVVKVGGDTVKDRVAFLEFAQDLVEMHRSGQRFVVIHGGGPQASSLMSRLGLTPNFVGGRRVTDEGTLEAVRMAVAGQVSTEIASVFAQVGLPAVCTSGISSHIINARRRPPRQVMGVEHEVDFGLVGDVYQVETEALTSIMDAGLVPVLACLGVDPRSGAILNINADVVSVDIAAAMNADTLFAISNVPGVLKDPSDPQTRIGLMGPDDIQRGIEDGTIFGGMVAKLEEAQRALRLGVGRVMIAGPANGGVLAAALRGEQGTVVALEG